METVRQNPLPAALVGIGLGWLWMNRRSAPAHRAVRYDARYDARYGDERRGYYSTSYRPDGYAYSGGQQDGGMISQAAGRVGETAGNVASTVGETASNAAGAVGETVGNVAGTVGETVGNVASTVGETASNLVGGAQHGAQRAEDRFGRALQENPLAVGAVALAVGAAVGLALPQTQRENQLMGEARDTLVERAQEFAQETVEKVQHVATEAQQTMTETVKEEAKSQGLTAR
jgi:hypothetical protein